MALYHEYLQEFNFFIFPPLFNPDGTAAVTSISKTKLFTQAMCTNSTPDSSGLLPPIQPPSDYTILEIKNVKNDVFCSLSVLNFLWAYEPQVFMFS